MTPEAKPAASRLSRDLRCPQTYYVMVRANDYGSVWPVRHRVRCERKRWHPGPCRSGVALPEKATAGPRVGWAPVVWWKPMSKWSEWWMDVPGRAALGRIRAKLRAGRRAGPRRQSSPPP